MIYLAAKTTSRTEQPPLPPGEGWGEGDTTQLILCVEKAAPFSTLRISHLRSRL